MPLNRDPVMFEPTLEFVTCPETEGAHRMAYWQWGDAASGHVIVVGGLLGIGAVSESGGPMLGNPVKER